MSVTLVEPISAGASGKASGSDPARVSVSYRSSYRVTCSDPSDTSPIVLKYFETTASLPWMGRAFNFGNGFDANVICKDVQADYIEKSGGIFIVSCSHEPLEGNESQQQAASGQTVGGLNTEDPIKWYDDIEVSYSNITEAAESATFRGFENGKGNAFMPPDTVRAITNSANVPYDPPLLREITLTTIRITRNVKEDNGGTYGKYKNAVNNDAFSINKAAYGFRREYRPYFAKFTDYGQHFQIENKVKFFRETVAVTIHPRGWRRRILDMGRMRRLTEGDKDDAGNTISASDITENWVHHTALKDKDGFPVNEPVPLDGNGAPLAPGKPHVFLIYSIEDEVAFSGIKW